MRPFRFVKFSRGLLDSVSCLSFPGCFGEGEYIQDIARLTLCVGHHLDEIVAVGCKPKGICSSDRMEGVIVSGHCFDGFVS